MAVLTSNQRKRLEESRFQTVEDVLTYLQKQRQHRLIAIHELTNLVSKPGVNQREALASAEALAIENDLLSKLIKIIIG